MNMLAIYVAIILLSSKTATCFEGDLLRVFSPEIDELVQENIDHIETYEYVAFNYTISCNKSFHLLNSMRNSSFDKSRNISILLTISDTSVVDFEEVSSTRYDVDCDIERFEVIEFQAGHLGITDLNMEIVSPDESMSEQVKIQLRIKRKVTLFDVISIYVLAPLILLNKCAFGAKIDTKTLFHVFTKPVALCLCLSLQFIMMPFFAYIYGILFRLSEPMALALFVGAACPGGGGGYIFSYLVGGDVTLAISASLVSTLVAMGAMPATIWFYTYIRQVPNDIVIPYVKMVLMLLVIAVPISTGMYINRRWPKFASNFVKIIRPLSLFLIICGFAFLAVTSRYIVHGPAVGWILAVILPLSGFLFSILIGRVFGLSWPFSKAISLETGMKNTLLGIAVIELTYPQPEADLSSVLVIMVTLGHSSLSMLWYLCYLIKEKICVRHEGGNGFVKLRNMDSDDDDDSVQFLLETQ